MLVERIADWIRQEVERTGTSGAILGLSGGIDSAVVAGLASRGLGPERVLGVLLPANSNTLDQEHARLAATTFGIETLTVDLAGPLAALQTVLPPGNDLAVANLKPRLRMTALYYLANSRNLLVVGTGNRTELLVGYFTKYGDGGVDILPLGALYKRDVRRLAREIGVPEPIIAKPPSAGLWPGQTDEGELGMSYDDLDGVLAALDRGDTTGYPPDLVDRVKRLIARSTHKRRTPPVFNPSETAAEPEGIRG